MLSYIEGITADVMPLLLVALVVPLETRPTPDPAQLSHQKAGLGQGVHRSPHGLSCLGLVSTPTPLPHRPTC